MNGLLPSIAGLAMIVSGRLMRNDDRLIVPGSLVLLWGFFFAVMSTVTP
jgi:hypothetical protein